MRTIWFALATIAAPAALAQPPVTGEVATTIEMKVDRSVIFAPTEDGKLRILKVIDNDRTVQLPRVAGQVAVAMSFNNEGGTILEFNNGLSHNFDFDLHIVAPDGALIAPEHPVCTVGSNRVGVEHWPQPFSGLQISNFREVSGFTC